MFNYSYTDGNNVYDPTGHLRQEVDGGNRTHAFFYNNLYELTQETHPDFVSIIYGIDANGNRTSKNVNGVIDDYGVDAANKLNWVNRRTGGSPQPPNIGQNDPYTLLTYNANGMQSQRDRRFTTGGLRQIYDFLWDGTDALRQVKEGATSRLTASYNGDGLRVAKLG